MNKRGNTLIEVIVSFVVVSIISFAMISVYSSSKKITRNISIKECIVSEIYGIYNIFNSDPSSFIDNLSKAYTISDPNNIIIYYGKTFKLSNKETDNYLKLTYTVTDGIYKLRIDTTLKGKLLEEYSNLSRSVIDRVI